MKKTSAIPRLRRQAEARLAKQQQDSEPASDVDNQRLVHELQVHQIELEIQNDELLRARGEVETLLSQSILQFNDLYDFAPVGYLTLARDGRIQRINLSGAALLGMERSKLMKQRLENFVSAEYRPNFNAFVEKAASVREHQTCEVQLSRQDGQSLWLRLDAIGNDRQECWLALVDVTARKLEQITAARLRLLQFASDHTLGELLQETINELENLTGSRVGFYHFLERDQQTLGLQAWSTRTLGEMCMVVGMESHHPVVDAGIWADCIRERRAVIHNDYAAMSAVLRKGLPDGHSVIRRELVVPVFRGGLIVAILGVGNKSEDYTGQDLESAASLADLAWEIAERKQMEAALKSSEEKYRTVANFTYDWEAWRAPDGSYLYISPSCERISGYPAAEFLADPDLFVRIVHPDDQPKLNKHYQASNHEAREQDLTLEFRIVTFSGKLRWISHMCTPVFADSGEWLGRRESNRDITGRKLNEAALREAHDLLEQRVEERTAELSAANLKLEQAARMKDEFLASMSHELRTPLTGILGLAEVLQLPGKEPLTEKQTKYISHILNSGHHLLDLINDILDLSRLASGKFELALTPFSLAEICQQSLQMTREQAAARGLQASFSISPDVIIMIADARRVKQMIANLLSNAIKFSKQGGRFGIEVQGSQPAGEVRITVWDTGIGIKEQDLPRLFQSFVQLDARLAREYTGAGLGLAMVSKLAELHGGSVSVKSTFGSGSRFTVSLPWLMEEP